jgi:putative glutamine amidotransferase
MYGEGEVVVNSEHRRGVQRVARGFRVSANALDGVVEAIESEQENWFAVGVQWHPASATASGLDIQLFRGMVDFCRQGVAEPEEALCLSAA